MIRITRPALALATLAATTGIGATACAPPPCSWLVSSRGFDNFVTISTDSDRTPLSQLSIGNPYRNSNAVIATNGYTDFDGDRITDVFRATVVAADGSRQWQYRSGGRGNWIDLARGPGLSSLRFGEFNGDGKTDVFSTGGRLNDGSYPWLVSYSGTGNFVRLARGPALDRLALGDFDGDGRTDVFSTSANPSANYTWLWSRSGTSNFAVLGFGKDLPYIRFTDFDRDGRTDVFTTTPATGGTDTLWQYKPGGVGNEYTRLLGGPYLGALEYGDFNGDGRTDVFTATPRGDGTHQWAYARSGREGPYNMAIGPGLASLKIGYFDADFLTDVFSVSCS